MAPSPACKGIDVVGVDNDSHGRSCVSHETCGHFVKEGDYLFCKWAVQKFEEQTPEACVQVYKLATDGHAGCHVGYLPRLLLKSSRNKKGEKDGGRSYDGTWLKVHKDLRLSENSCERSRSFRNCGIVHCHVAQEHWLVGNDPFEVVIDIPIQNNNPDFLLPAAPTETDEQEG